MKYSISLADRDRCDWVFSLAIFGGPVSIDHCIVYRKKFRGDPRERAGGGEWWLGNVLSIQCPYQYVLKDTIFAKLRRIVVELQGLKVEQYPIHLL